MTPHRTLYCLPLLLSTLTVFGGGLPPGASAQRPAVTPNLAIINARIYTGEPGRAQAQAVTVTGKCIATVDVNPQIPQSGQERA